MQKQGSGITIGTGKRIADFDTVGAQIIITGFDGEE